MKNKTILAVGVHPDDMDFGVFGSIGKWVNEGATAYLYYLHRWKQGVERS